MQVEELIARYDGFIFDLDGTLIDSMPIHVAGWQHAASLFHFPFDPMWIHSLGGVPSRKIVGLLEEKENITLDADAITQVKSDYYWQRIDQVELFPSMGILLDQLRRHRPLAIGTGSILKNVEKILKRLQIIDWFTAISTADDVNHHKPAPDTFLLAAARMDMKPSRCLVFEDTEIGLQAAYRAQMDCVLIRNGKPDWTTLKENQ